MAEGRRMHVRKSWVLAPGFRREPLTTQVEVKLDVAGQRRGRAREVTQRSGNPWYDDSVVRAIQKASPLPPRRRAGRVARSCSDPRRADAPSC